MAVRLEDLSPEVRERIERQLEKEPAMRRQKFFIAVRVGKNWKVLTASTNLSRSLRRVQTLQTITPRACYETSIGNPPAVLVQAADLPTGKL